MPLQPPYRHCCYFPGVLGHQQKYRHRHHHHWACLGIAVGCSLLAASDVLRWLHPARVWRTSDRQCLASWEVSAWEEVVTHHLWEWSTQPYHWGLLEPHAPLTRVKTIVQQLLPTIGDFTVASSARSFNGVVTRGDVVSLQAS